MKVVDGIANSPKSKPPKPNPSPKDFAWPSQTDHDDAVAKKIAASLQELLKAKEWKPSELAKVLYGADNKGYARNSAIVRRWITAEHPIPNLLTAGYIAQALDVSMARLLEPEGKFNAETDLVGKRRAAAPKKRGRDVEKQRLYNKKYREKKKHGHTNGSGASEGNGAGWVLADGIPVPEYQFASSEEHPGHLRITITAIIPHPRAMAILHMLEHQVPED